MYAQRYSWVALVACLGLAGCTEENGKLNGHAKTEPPVTVIEPGPEALATAKEALINAKPGEIIEFAEGQFDFDNTLSLMDVDDVTIRGRGMDKTVLNFKGMKAGTGGEGLTVKANGITVHDLAIIDTPGDGIKVEGANGATFRKVKVEWTGGPKTENGAYGLYPVQSKDVLIEECEVYCCSDAGVYVGQSENIIVRRCRVERNVAGIEIENSIAADVYENVCTNNTGGILVFSLPDLPKVVNGRQCRVFDNQIIGNNHPNFGKEGNIVAEIPPGSGLLVMANDQVEVFRNKFKDNQTANVAVISFLITEREIKNKEVYDPYPESVYIYENTFEGGGDKPEGRWQEISPMVGGKLPDIVYDGIINKDKLVDGKMPKELGVYARANKAGANAAEPASVVHLDLINMDSVPNINSDPTALDGELPPLPEIKIEGVN